MDSSGLLTGPDGRKRCGWYHGEEDYRRYHDVEWGRPVTDDIRLFEKICLEGFQAGLSWLTILRKRENFRAAFAGFDFEQLATFTAEDVDRLVQNKGIVRHRGKIESCIHNAARACEMVADQGSLSNFFCQFQPPPEERPNDFSYATLRTLTESPSSKRLSTSLKKRGWKFVGPTTAYAFMQAMGLVNDHFEGCYCRAEIENITRD